MSPMTVVAPQRLTFCRLLWLAYGFACGFWSIFDHFHFSSLSFPLLNPFVLGFTKLGQKVEMIIKP